MHKSSAGNCSPVFLLAAFFILELAGVDGARAANVVNPSFELPVAGPPLNYIADPPTTSGIGWTFSDQPVGSNSGVQQSGVAFGDPVTTDGHQTGWILNLSMISQSIDFTEGGDYTVSFKVAYGSFSNELIKVTLDGVELQTVKPSSNKNFSQVTASFSTTSGKHTLRFAGIGPISTGEQAVVFIDEVAIKGPLPQISDGPKDLDPTSKIALKGSHFGNDKGEFRIHFPSASLVHFANTSSKDNLDLDVDGKWTDDGTIESEKIVTASPVGSVSEQTVDITVIAANGQTSSVWHAKFHNDAVITSGPKTISHFPKVSLKGWDFGEDPGKLTVHFAKPSFVEFTGQTPHSKSDRIAEAKADEWKPGSMAVQVPLITGVVEQTAEISVTTKDGRKSNTWKADFDPLIVFTLLPWNDVTVVTCSNQGVTNQCNSAFSSGVVTPLCAVDAVGALFGLVSIAAEHDGCFGLDSDDGTDTYTARVKNGWKIERLDNMQTANDNGSVSGSWTTPVPPIAPSDSISMVAPWHIGATGGYVNYSGNIVLKGPVAVPFD